MASAGALGAAGSVLVTTTSASASAALAAKKPAKFVVEGVKLPKVGRVLEASSRPLYALENHASCTTTSCLAVWHPVILPDGVKRAQGEKFVKQSRIGSVTTPQGRQVTYYKYQLYWFTGDTSKTTLNGNGVADTWGTWSAVKTNGKLAAETSISPTTTGAGGYGY